MPRETPELRVALINYGEFWMPVDLIRFEGFLQKRFSQATSDQLTHSVIGSKVLPFLETMPPGYTYKNITDLKRLQRIWYWENVGTGVGQEIYSEYTKDAVASSWKDVDLILGVTGAQVADVLIHEIGHSLSLGHANDPCTATELSTVESDSCYAKSPSRNDIMGYCRDRSPQHVNENSYNQFEACTLDILNSRGVPLMIEGGPRRINEILHCN